MNDRELMRQLLGEDLLDDVEEPDKRYLEELELLESGGYNAGGPTAEELAWLEQSSEDDVRMKIMELAEEIGRETKLQMMLNRCEKKPDLLNDHDLLALGGSHMPRRQQDIIDDADLLAMRGGLSNVSSDRSRSSSSASYLSPKMYETRRRASVSFTPPANGAFSEQLVSEAKYGLSPPGLVRSTYANSPPPGLQTSSASLSPIRDTYPTQSTNARQPRVPQPLLCLNPGHGTRKRRLCRHFLKGHCKRGDTCDFLHDSSIFCPDEQKIFLGGLPAHVTADVLVQRLNDLGYAAINKPKVLRGFTPQVCLSSEDQAQRLIAVGKICIDGCMVDVRPYEDKKPPDDVKRSVFLGGLPTGITSAEIKRDLLKIGVEVSNHPIVKAGFSPQVVVSTPNDAQNMIKAKKVMVGGKMVEVRPYVNFRKRY